MRDTDSLELIGYSALGIVAVAWIISIIGGFLFAGMTMGQPLVLVIGLLVIVGVGMLIIKVIKDRINSKEDDYYSKNVER